MINHWHELVALEVVHSPVAHCISRANPERAYRVVGEVRRALTALAESPEDEQPKAVDVVTALAFVLVQAVSVLLEGAKARARDDARQ